MARQRPSQCAASDLNEIIETSLEVSTYALRSCAIAVELQLAAALPPVWGNADQLNQVVINLIINAQQALEEHPGPRRLAMITTLDRVSDRVVFTIRDNGPGIPAEIRSRIFEPFFTTKQVGAGTGVGLALCHRIVESHNGCLTVNAAAGGGAEFVIRLPARAVQTSAPSAPQLESETTPALLRILVIDDEADVAELIADILDSDGHSVDIAQSGEAALDKIEQTDFAAIVSDLRMPGLDGPGLYQVLQQNKPWLLARLGFITGDTLGNRVHNFLQSAGRPYIEKPITPQDVRALLHDLTVNTGNADD
jgi:CheY-like chemotaxis protein